jgi:hypothetical protein
MLIVNVKQVNIFKAVVVPYSWRDSWDTTNNFRSRCEKDAAGLSLVVIGRRPLTAGARVRARVKKEAIFGGQYTGGENYNPCFY